MPAVGALEKGVRVWAKELEHQGFTCEVDVHRSGQGGDRTASGSSYVEITIEREEDEGRGRDWVLETYRFIAGDNYGSGKHDIRNGSWREMKAEAVARLKKVVPDLKEDSMATVREVLAGLSEGEGGVHPFVAEIKRIRSMTAANDHLGAWIAGAKLLRAPKKFVERFELIERLRMLDGGLDGALAKYAHGYYEDLMHFAKENLTPEEYEAFHDSF